MFFQQLDEPRQQRNRIHVDLFVPHDLAEARVAAAVAAGGSLHLALDGRVASFDDVTYAPPRRSEQAAESTVSAPMNGRVLAVLVQAGDAVTKGQRLAVLEAMKMEHQLVARRDGVVERVAVRAGDQVATRAVIATLVEAAAPS